MIWCRVSASSAGLMSLPMEPLLISLAVLPDEFPLAFMIFPLLDDLATD